MQVCVPEYDSTSLPPSFYLPPVPSLLVLVRAPVPDGLAGQAA